MDVRFFSCSAGMKCSRCSSERASYRAATKFMSRMQKTKMRCAARLAGQLAMTRKEILLREQGGQYESKGSGGEEESDED